MERKEFMKTPSEFSFCVSSLDVNLANMQYGLLEQMDARVPDEFSPIVEEFKSEDPEKGYGEITVIIYKYVKSQENPQYKATLTVANKRGNYVISALLYIGNREEMYYFIEGKTLIWGGIWDFFSICKANALWLDHQVKHGEDEKMTNKLKGKAKFLGWGKEHGAYGVFATITRCLLNECKLIVRTNACVSYAGNDITRNAVENYGVGLRLVEIHAINNYDIEAVFEPIPDAPPRYVHVNRVKQMPPANAYVLATDFGGEFWIKLFREDAKGNRIYLWGDDYINK